MDIQKQVDYWKTSSDEDFAAAESLLEKGHLRHCLFFAHLAIEKMLKAHVTRQTKDVPPRTHNLVRLAEIAELSLSPEQTSLLGGFGARTSWKVAIRIPSRFYWICKPSAGNLR